MVRFDPFSAETLYRVGFSESRKTTFLAQAVAG